MNYEPLNGKIKEIHLGRPAKYVKDSGNKIRVVPIKDLKSAVSGLLKEVKDLQYHGTIWRYQDIELLIHKWFGDAI